MKLELRHLRYFVAVAEELSFRRAAERLHVSQPPLSLQIRQLEEEVGGVLFDRSQQKVSLTAAGRVFLQHARHVLQEAAIAQASVKRALEGEEGEIRIGFTPSSEFLPFLPETIYQFRKLRPGVHLVLREMPSASQIEAIEDHKLDLGILRKPRGRLISSVRLSRLSSDAVLLALHESDPLAKKAHVQVKDLRGHPLICTARSAGAGLHEFVTDLCWAAGFSPNIVQETQQVSTLIALVATGLGSALVPAPLQCIQLNKVVYRPLIGRSTRADLFVVTNAKDKNPQVEELRKMLLAAVTKS